MQYGRRQTALRRLQHGDRPAGSALRQRINQQRITQLQIPSTGIRSESIAEASPIYHGQNKQVLQKKDFLSVRQAVEELK